MSGVSNPLAQQFARGVARSKTKSARPSTDVTKSNKWTEQETDLMARCPSQGCNKCGKPLQMTFLSDDEVVFMCPMKTCTFPMDSPDLDKYTFAWNDTVSGIPTDVEVDSFLKREHASKKEHVTTQQLDTRISPKEPSAQTDASDSIWTAPRRASLNSVEYTDNSWTY